VTAAQVLIQWEYSLGMPVNVRSQNSSHMVENLNSYSFALTADEVKVLNSGPQAVDYDVKPRRKPVKPTFHIY